MSKEQAGSREQKSQVLTRFARKQNLQSSQVDCTGRAAQNEGRLAAQKGPNSQPWHTKVTACLALCSSGR